MWKQAVVFCEVLAFGIFLPSAAQPAFPVLATEGRPQNEGNIHTDLIPDRREREATIPEGLPIERLSLLSNATNRRSVGTIHTDLIRDRRETESRSVNSCGCARNQNLPQRRIVGGHIVDSKDKYPYQVFFQAKRHVCGGTIINKRYVVTAMHCLYDHNGDGNEHDASKTSVIAGEHYRPWDGPNEGGQRIAVDYFIKRSDYDNITYANDIAILKLKKDIKFTDNVKPACLPTDITKKYVGQWGIITGWGSTVGHDFGERRDTRISDNLKETSVKILGRRKCDPVTDNDFDTRMCAFKSGTDSCQGDSGGALTVVENGKYTMVGVVSYGKGCADVYPAVYVRVTNYLSWISQNTQDGECSGGSGESICPYTDQWAFCSNYKDMCDRFMWLSDDCPKTCKC